MTRNNWGAYADDLARVIGAAIVVGSFAYLMQAPESDHILAILARSAICPVIAMIFSAPRCATRLYLRNGAAVAMAFALGYTWGKDFSDPVYETLPGLIVIVAFLLASLAVFVGLLLLVSWRKVSDQ